MLISPHTLQAGLSVISYLSSHSLMLVSLMPCSLDSLPSAVSAAILSLLRCSLVYLFTAVSVRSQPDDALLSLQLSVKHLYPYPSSSVNSASSLLATQWEARRALSRSLRRSSTSSRSMCCRRDANDVIIIYIAKIDFTHTSRRIHS